MLSIALLNFKCLQFYAQIQGLEFFVLNFLFNASNYGSLPCTVFTRASAGNRDRNVSVCLSVRLSRAGIVSKRRKLAA